MKMMYVRYGIIIVGLLSPLSAFAVNAVDNPLPAMSPTIPESKDDASLAEEDSPNPAKFQGTNFDLLSRKGELMIKQRDMNDIYDALSGIEVRKPNNNSNVAIAVDAPATAPSFFLKSVLYFSQVNWSAWVNDRKFTPFYNKNYTAKGDIDFEIASVNHDRVQLIWNAHYLDSISPGWREKLLPADPSVNHTLKEPGFVSSTGKIFVSQDASRVEVTLAPNQTFVTHEMDIEEGYVAPVAIMIPAQSNSADKNLKINSPVALVKSAIPIQSPPKSRGAEATQAVNPLDGTLDYKAMDARGFPHERIEDIFKICLDTTDMQTYGKAMITQLCACDANGIVNLIPKEEFIAYDDSVRSKTADPNSETNHKIAKIATDCRIKYFGK